MQIFKSAFAGLDSALDEKGYVKISLLPPDAVRQLLELYDQSPNARNPHFGFHVSLDIPSPETIQMISGRIAGVIRPYVDNCLENYKFISPRFAVKEPDTNSRIPPHQDWSFVDETHYQSYNLWIAITPSTLHNGTLGFLNRSHIALQNLRATPLPLFQVPFHDYAYELSDEMEFVELEPGEALLFNSRIIHASMPNVTREPRISIAVEITAAEAPLMHYYLSPISREIIEYAIDDSFFTKYSNAKLTRLHQENKLPDDYPVNRRIPNTVKKMDKKMLLTLCK